MRYELRSYFDNVRHDRLLAKVAQRVDDAEVMRSKPKPAENRAFRKAG